MRYPPATLALYGDLFEDALTHIKEAMAPALRNALLAGAGGAAGLGLGATGGYFAGKSQGAEEAEKERLRTRNISFGTGLAAGVISPHLIRGLGQIARGASSTGLFPGFQSMGMHR